MTLLFSGPLLKSNTLPQNLSKLSYLTYLHEQGCAKEEDLAEREAIGGDGRLPNPLKP
jgi:hypothetical protein